MSSLTDARTRLSRALAWIAADGDLTTVLAAERAAQRKAALRKMQLKASVL